MKKAILLLIIFTLLPLYGCGGTKQIEANGDLVIAALRENEFLNAAARKYEEANDGVKVTIIAYWKNGADMDFSKYSQIINTALMSGKGEDIIDVSSLTWTKLADRGKLADLNGLISFDTETYFMNILDAYLYNEKRYAIPLCFSFEAYRFYNDFSDKEIKKDVTINDTLALAGKYPENPLFDGSGFGTSKTSLAYKLFCLNFSDFLDMEMKEATVDNAEFISLLETVSSFPEPLAGYPGALIGQALVYTPAMTNNGTEDLSNMFLLTNAAGGALFDTVGFMPAINANSENKELAADFIKFLLSEETLTSPELYFCPVNKKAADEKAKLMFESVLAGGWAPEGFDYAALERNIAAFNALAGKLSLVENADYFIRDFVTAEMERYFQGRQDAAQTAKNLQSRLNTYLKE